MAWIAPFQEQRYRKRREQLLEQVYKHFDNQPGVMLFFGDFEITSSMPFKQESSLYYFTGITEPGAALAFSADEGATLFVPNFGREREKWVAGVISPETMDHYDLGVNAIEYLGSPIPGYQLYPFFSASEFQNLIQRIEQWLEHKYVIYTLAPRTPGGYVQQRFILERLEKWIGGLSKAVVDISDVVAQMRRKKDDHELSLMRQAIDITLKAQEAAVSALHVEAYESDVEATIEYTFLKHGAMRAFPSIVATGKNGTVLHYTANNAPVKNGDIVVVDIGARYGYYCADITRTYPVESGFSIRQRQAYDVVLAAQRFIEQQAKPGMWLSNRDYQDRSLQHLAKKFLQDHGYGDFFLHGIGHYLGLDVHDVGSYATPLQPGDVITIEPGVYLAHENFGIRIEDNYLITEQGSECLSAALAKDPEEIQDLVLSMKSAQ
jgi:Xaa-Pro aminopeptidase